MAAVVVWLRYLLQVNIAFLSENLMMSKWIRSARLVMITGQQAHMKEVGVTHSGWRMSSTTIFPH